MITTLVAMAATAGMALPAAGSQATRSIVLPGATSAEGIAVGPGSTFYAGDLFAGDIFRGDLQHGTVARFIDAPPGRQALGMVVDVAHGLLFVAGAFTGQAYAYDTTTGETVASYQFGAPGETLVNDATLTKGGVWFTDAFRPQLFFVPISPTGTLGAFRTLTLSGPAVDASGFVNLNGIRATGDGSVLIVAHSSHGRLYTIDPATGASLAIAGVSVPNVDGIVLEAGRVWAVQSFRNQITRIRLGADLTSGVVEKTITDELFQVPTTAANFGNRLAVVNAKLDTGLPPTAEQYEVILVRR